MKAGDLAVSQGVIVVKSRSLCLFDCLPTLCYLQEFPLPECLPLVPGKVRSIVRSNERGEETERLKRN